MARKKPSSKAQAPERDTAETPEDTGNTVTTEDAATDKIETDAEDAVKETSSDAAETGAESGDSAPEEGTAEVSDTDDPSETAPDEEPVTAETTEAADTPVHTPAPMTTEQVVIRKGGFVPMVLGGLVAAGVGFGVARYVLPEGGATFADFQATTEKALEDQSSGLASLSDRLETLAAGPDLSGIESAQANFNAAVESLTDRIATIETQLADFDARFSDLAARPLTEGASEAAVAAYEQELKRLQDAMAAQRAEIEAMAAGARAMEENAAETAQATMRRAAVTRIQTALENGTGFAAALADLEAAGLSAPDALTRVAQDGVASLAALQDSFPDAARAALAVSRKEATEGGESTGFSAFLRNQLGARSLEPREGDDPDAVLSRAEAAVREGRLMDALAEIEGLPEIGRAELSDWAGTVAQRVEAISAAQSLGENLN